MAIIIDSKDQTWIDAGKDEQTKASRKAALINLLEMNGLKYDPGIGKSYIPEKNYYVRIDDKSIPDGAVEAYEKAMNFVALGGGIGGLAGCGVRWGLRDAFSRKRETIVIDTVNDECDDAVRAFTEFSARRKEVVPFWFAQASNVLALAGAIFNREMHHWNADNTKPQQALLGALGQQDEIPESEFRKLFYLSIHPIPLGAMEDLRAAVVAGTVAGISDAVAVRCRSAPAGYGDIHATAQGAEDLKAEPFFGSFGANIRKDVDKLINLNVDIMLNASEYHVFAPAYGKVKKTIDKAAVKRAMVCCAAYIIVHVKGSLIQSAALRKFRNSNQRNIQKWIAAFETEANEAHLTLVELAKD